MLRCVLHEATRMDRALPPPLPLDHPTPERPHRVYAALTNHCNRACPWCSTCSSPRGQTFLSLRTLELALPETGSFELQLEGGEPTIHPQFWDFVAWAQNHPRCVRWVVCTNGVVLPRTRDRLTQWLMRLGESVTLKLSFNHHLIQKDPGLLRLAQDIVSTFQRLGGARLFVLNVRLRRGIEDDDRWVRDAVENAGLLPHANIFFLQRYGFASDESEWEIPFLAGHNFTLINPDGTQFGPDLIARSEAMRQLEFQTPEPIQLE